MRDGNKAANIKKGVDILGFRLPMRDGNVTGDWHYRANPRVLDYL